MQVSVENGNISNQTKTRKRPERFIEIVAVDETTDWHRTGLSQEGMEKSLERLLRHGSSTLGGGYLWVL